MLIDLIPPTVESFGFKMPLGVNDDDDDGSAGVFVDIGAAISLLLSHPFSPGWGRRERRKRSRKRKRKAEDGPGYLWLWFTVMSQSERVQGGEMEGGACTGAGSMTIQEAEAEGIADANPV
ncbi:hypothetical protein D9757_009231 [Collybiopsis confluens]|uniref:Uncharacterized protein n=1 Tax=Collybiopsis confluens TaxID=2823264 RepID=A0A8H5H9Y0_9AGAR|nr:hypothetical protein D9757_009231 [Collybiopsis confluens]